LKNKGSARGSPFSSSRSQELRDRKVYGGGDGGTREKAAAKNFSLRAGEWGRAMLEEAFFNHRRGKARGA